MVDQYLSEGWEELYGGKLEFVSEGEEILRRTLAHIDRKRADLGLPAYDPTRYGRSSGDARMRELETLPLADRREALYGAAD